MVDFHDFSGLWLIILAMIGLVLASVVQCGMLVLRLYAGVPGRWFFVFWPVVAYIMFIIVVLVFQGWSQIMGTR